MYSKVLIGLVLVAFVAAASACDVKATSYTTEGEKKEIKLKLELICEI
jgi:hypothetical protein